MENWAKLITAVAALVRALAWPVALLVAVLSFRQEVRSFLAKIPSVIDRMKALKLGIISTELERVADQSSSAPKNAGLISIAEVEASVRIEAEAVLLDDPILVAQLDKLCVEYDTIRRVMPPSDRRTSAMTRILVQMRSLGPALFDRIESYKSSESPGGRLAAVAMMQMRPEKADLDWLVKRFAEDQPFVFYHAALAMQNIANGAVSEQIDAVKKAAEKALETVNSFSGTADASSVHVLESLINHRSSGHYS